MKFFVRFMFEFAFGAIKTIRFFDADYVRAPVPLCAMPVFIALVRMCHGHLNIRIYVHAEITLVRIT